MAFPPLMPFPAVGCPPDRNGGLSLRFPCSGLLELEANASLLCPVSIVVAACLSGPVYDVWMPRGPVLASMAKAPKSEHGSQPSLSMVM